MEETYRADGAFALSLRLLFIPFSCRDVLPRILLMQEMQYFSSWRARRYTALYRPWLAMGTRLSIGFTLK